MTAPEFRAWDKIPRLNRDIVITEKIDGTNAAIIIQEDGTYAQSRSRILNLDSKMGDNFGFYRWVLDHEGELRGALGPGIHYGEWYGRGIQRGYGLLERWFALFNVARFQDVPFADLGLLEVSVVPKLFEGPFSQVAIDQALNELRSFGSNVGDMFAAEGIVIFHTAAGNMFKVTLEGDGEPKSVRDARLAEVIA